MATKKGREKWQQSIFLRHGTLYDQLWSWNAKVRRNWMFVFHTARGSKATAELALAEAEAWIDQWFKAKAMSGSLFKDLYDKT